MNRYLKKTTLHFAFWILIFFIQFLLIINIKSFEETTKRSVINIVFIVLIYYYTRHIVLNFYEKEKIKTWLKRQCFMIFIVGIVRSSLEIFYLKTNIFSEVIHPNDNYYYIFSGAILFIILAAFVSFFISFYFIIKKRKEIEEANKQLKMENIESQLAMLNNQLSPHFLFNCLNDVYAAIVLNQAKAGEMILKLSEIMRYITYDTNRDKIFLSYELKQVEHYLDFFSLKSEVKLNHTLTGFEENGKEMVVPMMLIPLVENALKHGNFNDIESKPFLKIDITQNGNTLCMQVENSFEKNIDKRTIGGMGLENYQKRLLLKYPDKHSFEQNNDNGVYRSIIKLQLD